MEMNVSTSAIDRAIRTVNKHVDVIFRLTVALKQNVVLAESEYNDVNYKKLFNAIENVERSIRRISARRDEVERSLHRLKNRVDDYNETGYRG